MNTPGSSLDEVTSVQIPESIDTNLSESEIQRNYEACKNEFFGRLFNPSNLTYGGDGWKFLNNPISDNAPHYTPEIVKKYYI